jgi:hypothetical protein
MVESSYLLDTAPFVGLIPFANADVTWSGGKPVYNASARLQIRALITPLPDNEVTAMPEGEWVKGHFLIFTRERVYVNDLVFYEGDTYHVQQVQSWGYFCQARMVQITGAALAAASAGALS